MCFVATAPCLSESSMLLDVDESKLEYVVELSSALLLRVSAAR